MSADVCTIADSVRHSVCPCATLLLLLLLLLSTDQLAELRTTASTTQASLRSIEALYSSSTENERSYKLRLQAVEGELSIVRKDRDWNHGELERVSEEAARDRREKVGAGRRLPRTLAAILRRTVC